MYIGKVAKLSGVTIKSIRHYEDIGLMPLARREGRYRVYCERSVETLRFIKCAQQLGFKLKELKGLFENHNEQAALRTVVGNAIDGKKRQLKTQIDALQRLQADLIAFEGHLEQHGLEELTQCLLTHGE
jgi:DNA-binding transcriptional MerR regulator